MPPDRATRRDVGHEGDSAGFALSRGRAAGIVAACYAAVAVAVAVVLPTLISLQKYDDARDEQVTAMLAVIMAAMCIRALFIIYR